MNDTVLTQENNGVLTLTINRPERRNALDVATYLSLAEHIRAASKNQDCRALVITGASNYFTAGNDLKDFQKPRTSGDSGGIILLRSLIDCDLPIIAAVEGRAIGIGVTMQLPMDMRLASTEALHPLQAAFVKHDAFQCGYCTPGQICSAAGLAAEHRASSRDEIREHMSGNLCRCGAYPNILAAIEEALPVLRGQEGAQ